MSGAPSAGKVLPVDLEMLPIRIPAILISLTIHEYAHGFVAWRRGDSTARDAGRLTLNPLSHLDVFGTLMLLFGPFGWAKPVPVNIGNLHHPKRDIVWVSAAGPLANISLALVVGYTYRLLHLTGAAQALPPFAQIFMQFLLVINLGLAFFNLLPVPPLDGSNIVAGLLPTTGLAAYAKFARHAPKVFMGLLFAEWALKVPVFSMLIEPLWKPWFALWQWVIFGGAGM